MVRMRSESAAAGRFPAAPRARDLLLHEAALAGARLWTSGWLRTLAHEGRPVEGGWPGTLNEARARARDNATRALAREAMTALSSAEQERLTRVVYDEARRLWQVSTKAT